MRIIENITTNNIGTIIMYLEKNNQYYYVEINAQRSYVENNTAYTLYALTKISITNDTLYIKHYYQLLVELDKTLKDSLNVILDDDLVDIITPYYEANYSYVKSKLCSLIRNDKLNLFLQS